MSKVIRISNETIKLLEIYKKQIKADFASARIKGLDEIKEDLLLQSALLWAIECETR